MTFNEIDAYIARLTASLRTLGIVDARIIEETRGHLVDDVEKQMEHGVAADIAQRDAIARFGDVQLVAASIASDRYRLLDSCLFIAALMLGLVIAYIDSRPHWDDAGITAGLMFLSSAIFSTLAPRHPWVWALAIGSWLPLLTIVRSHSAGSALMSIVLLFPLAGAYAGLAVRRMLRAVA
jgi:hypothetical protein